MSARPTPTYRDPLEQMLKAEELTCKGCQYREPASNGMKAYCSNPKQRNPLAVKRCEHYEEVD
jgi:hypothetical protein